LTESMSFYILCASEESPEGVMGPEPKGNCWEYMHCERQPGGKLHATEGGCPAAIDAVKDGINSGKNGGRICWDVAGTFCFGEVQGCYARKIQGCMDCGFFWRVVDEEDDLILSAQGLCDTNGKGRMASIGKTSASAVTSPDQ
jgi:hypothetical protein